MLKRLYPDGLPENVASRDRVLFTKVKKVKDFQGESIDCPIIYANPGGRSHTVANVYTAASTQNTPGKYTKFVLTRAENFASVLIGSHVLHASNSDRGAFVRARKTEVDGMLDEMGHSLSIELYGDGNCVRGRRSSASTNVITLVSPDDVKNFRVGMTVEAGPNADGSSLRSGSTTVAGVDEDSGTVTLTSAAAITSFADSDYLFEKGDSGALGIKGLSAWLPLTAPGSTSFFGVDRSVDTTRLGGVRYDGATLGSTIEESIMHVAERVRRVGGKPDVVMINPVNFTTLSKSLSAKIEYEGGGGSAVIGFETIKIATSAGILTVYPDPDCPIDRFYVLTMKTWTLHYMGPGCPHIVDDDGQMAVRVDGADSIAVRGRFYGQLGCVAPAWNGVGSI